MESPLGWQEDIPLLVQYFTEKIGARIGKRIKDIPKKIMAKLIEYEYPGNVRELQNLIERGVITSRKGKLNLYDFNPKKSEITSKSFQSLEDHQKFYINEVLKHTRWKVSGVNGAASILGMKPTTLFSRMEKLGIKRSIEAVDV